MTSNTLSPAASVEDRALLASAGLADRSRQGWLRELERAQAGLLGTLGDAGSVKPREIHRTADEQELNLTTRFAKEVLPEDGRASVPLQSQIWQVQAVALESSIVQASGEVSAATYLGGGEIACGVAPIMDVAEAEFVQPPVLGDMRLGYEEREVSSSSFKLLRSGEGLVDVAVRDPEISLASELRLNQQIRAAVESIGSKLGRVWLNGHTIQDNSQGGKNGN